MIIAFEIEEQLRNGLTRSSNPHTSSVHSSEVIVRISSAAMCLTIFAVRFRQDTHQGRGIEAYKACLTPSVLLRNVNVVFRACVGGSFMTK